MKEIIIENKHLRLVVGSDCVAKSLLCKDSGEECLMEGFQMPLFSVTQDRPFNNEIKLAYPCKHTTYQANRLRREGNKLIMGFEIAPYEAVVLIDEQPEYVNFSLEGFIVHEGDYGHLTMDMPPATQFRLLQLPIKNRKNFGEWLNVSWDENTAINVLATAPQTIIDSELRGDHRIMYADVRSDIRMRGPGAALIVNAGEKVLDSIASMEEDFGLPKGVESRRSKDINASVYWVSNLCMDNVDEHIKLAKQGGFRMMLVYYTSFYKETEKWGFKGNYDFQPTYPNGLEDVKAVIAKVREAGITPGIHFLQTHIGLKSRLVTPVADHRLRLIRHFTLAKPLGIDDTTIYVEQDTYNTVMADKRRVLQFGGELITYEGYTTEYPFCFTGCVRGAYATNVKEHPLGEIGGVLDVSEYGGGSCYLDQDSSLANEVAKKLSDTYNCGFQFVYFDGSEGTNIPYEYHIPNGQYRVYKNMQPQPLFAEGAAKAHFSWHMLSGGNAFDVFRPAIFKAMIAEHPAQEAPRMHQDFTRVNFGWWGFFGAETQADMYEYGTSRAAAWDCPITLQAYPEKFKENPRFADVFEVMRRWEEVRATDWLTKEQKTMLQDLKQEHILLINEQKEFELVPYYQIEGAASGNEFVSAFHFTRNEENYVVYWLHNADGTLRLPLDGKDFAVVEELWEQPLALENNELPIGKRRYIKSKLPVEELIEAVKKAVVEA